MTGCLAWFPQVIIHRGDFAHFNSTARDGMADLITMVAVLHHLDLEDTLARIPRLIAPGGRLLVVGLARADSLADLAMNVVSSAANPVVGMINHPRRLDLRLRTPDEQLVPPTMDPATTLTEIKKAAAAHLPASSIRRRLFFRCTLRWDKPQ